MRVILRGMKLSIIGDGDIVINLVIAAFAREWRECVLLEPLVVLKATVAPACRCRRNPFPRNIPFQIFQLLVNRFIAW
jgi:hypothetical protein